MDKKKVPDLAIILGHKAPGDDSGGDDGGDADQAKLDAAKALIEAVNAKDEQGVVEALGALHDLHASDDDESDDEES